MKLRAVLTIVSVLAGLLAVQSTQTPAMAASWTVSGKVTNIYGANMPNVTVGLEQSPGGIFSQGLTDKTDGNGNYSIGGVDTGTYFIGVHAGSGDGQTNAPQHFQIDTTVGINVSADKTQNLNVPEVAVTLHAADDNRNPVAGAVFDVTSDCPQQNLSLGAGLAAQGCSSYSTQPVNTNHYPSPVPVTNNSGNATYWMFPTNSPPPTVWNSATTYQVGDDVDFNGMTYRAIQANTNEEPDVSPSFWQSPPPFLYTVTAHSFFNDWNVSGNEQGCQYRETTGSYTDISSNNHTTVHTERTPFCPWSWAPFQFVTSVLPNVAIGAASSSYFPTQEVDLVKPQNMQGHIQTPNGDNVGGVKVELETSRGGTTGIAAEAKTDSNGNYSFTFEPRHFDTVANQWVSTQYFIRVEADNQFPLAVTNVAPTYWIETTTASSFGGTDHLSSFNDNWPDSAFGASPDGCFAENTSVYPLEFAFGGSGCPIVSFDNDVIGSVPTVQNWPATTVTNTLNLTLPEHKVNVTVEGETTSGVFTTPLQNFTIGAADGCPTPNSAWTGLMTLNGVQANSCASYGPGSIPLVTSDSGGHGFVWLPLSSPNPSAPPAPNQYDYTITATPPSGSPYVTGQLQNVHVGSSDQSVTVDVSHARPSVTCSKDNAPQINPPFPAQVGGWQASEVTYSCTATDDVSDGSPPGGFPSNFQLTTSVGAGNVSSTAVTNSQQVCDSSNFCTSAGPFPPPPGLWNSTTTYNSGSQVTFNGISYVAKLTNSNKEPDTNPTFWSTPAPALKIDRKGPSFTCAPSTNWYGSNTGVICHGIDNGAGLNKPTDSTFSLPTHVTAGTANASAATDTYSLCDVLGQCVTAGPYTIKVDLIPPTINCTKPPVGTTSNTDLTASCTATDTFAGLSGMSPGQVLSFTLSTHVANNTSNNAAFTNARSVCTNAGFCVTVGPFGPYHILKQGPKVTITSPSSTTPYELNQVVHSSFTCQPGTAFASVTLCSGASTVDTSSIGSHTFTVTATDSAGNVTIASRSYAVGYSVCPLFAGSLSAATGGPITLSLCNATGTNKSASNITVKAVKLTFTSSTPAKNFPLNQAFTFSPLLGSGGGYSLRLLGWQPGNYILYFQVSGDPIVHSVSFTFS